MIMHRHAYIFFMNSERKNKLRWLASETKNQTQIEKKTLLCRKLCWWFLVSQHDLLQALLPEGGWLCSSRPESWILTSESRDKPGISDRMAADKIYEHKLACRLIAGCQKRALSQIRACLYKMELVELNCFTAPMDPVWMIRLPDGSELRPKTQLQWMGCACWGQTENWELSDPCRFRVST